jgi:hypothetical protein
MTTASDNNNGRVFIFQASSGTPADEVYLWGAQLETGSVATSYIPTSGGDAAARTRAADNLLITGSDFTDFFNPLEGTFFVTARIKDRERKYPILYHNSISRFLYSNAGDTSVSTYDGVYGLGYSAPNADDASNFALSYSSSNSEMKGAKDGNAESNVSYSGNFSTATDLRIGWGYGTMNGHIRRIIYWPYSSDNL